ncbi:hypothetical protein C6P46_001735 [Rhodotorula mucilaginosa]|uniref:Uncharacterized protein n=1 Tax=Rhodotorula mucilaginosa TaxID=5537 RepID=A0A9P6W6X9_RHOMI|nr:hypothetical protein C6P46_001735 [Rhodotorula mucilaginosa]
MSYYPFDADTDKEVSLVFLPARAAAVATTLSGLASFIALVLTAEVAYSVDSLGSNESALLEVTAVFCGIVVATGIALIYVRVQPPTVSNLWAVVPQVISYVMVLCLATIGFATASIFVALVPLARCDGDSCEHRNRAVRTICARAIAVVAIASLGILVTYELHATRPKAEAVVYQAQVRETMLYSRWRRDQLDGEALWVARNETGTSEENKKVQHHEHEHKHKQRKHDHRRKGRHHHHHHRHCQQDGTTSDSASSSSEEDRRRRRSKKATVDANVMSRQSAASSVASANAGDSMPTE